MENNFEVLVENINSSANSIFMLSSRFDQTSKLTGGLKSEALSLNKDFLNNNRDMHQNIDALVNNLQSTNFSDKLISWFGLFDEEVKGLNCKRSELLAKKDVKNYTYKRHTWYASTMDAMYSNIIYFINSALGAANYAVKANEDGRDMKEVDKELEEWMKYSFKPACDEYIFGLEPKVLYNKIIEYEIGNKLIPMNFADDYSISDMMDLCDLLVKIDIKKMKEAYANNVKEIGKTLDSYMADFSFQAKRLKNNSITLKWIKEINKVIAKLMIKLSEWVNGVTESLTVISKELLAVLKGLLEYKGE